MYITTRILMTGDLEWKWEGTAVTYLRYCRTFSCNTEKRNKEYKKI